MARGRAAAGAAESLTDAVIFSILLFLALWILGLLFSGFGAVFGFGNSFLFALAYLVARAVYAPVQAAVSSLLGWPHRPRAAPGRTAPAPTTGGPGRPRLIRFLLSVV